MMLKAYGCAMQECSRVVAKIKSKANMTNGGGCSHASRMNKVMMKDHHQDDEDKDEEDDDEDDGDDDDNNDEDEGEDEDEEQEQEGHGDDGNNDDNELV